MVRYSWSVLDEEELLMAWVAKLEFPVFLSIRTVFLCSCCQLAFVFRLHSILHCLKYSHPTEC